MKFSKSSAAFILRIHTLLIWQGSAIAKGQKEMLLYGVNNASPFPLQFHTRTHAHLVTFKISTHSNMGLCNPSRKHYEEHI